MSVNTVIREQDINTTPSPDTRAQAPSWRDFSLHLKVLLLREKHTHDGNAIVRATRNGIPACRVQNRFSLPFMQRNGSMMGFAYMTIIGVRISDSHVKE
jgi:hypothetical protein